MTLMRELLHAYGTLGNRDLVSGFKCMSYGALLASSTSYLGFMLLTLLCVHGAMVLDSSMDMRLCSSVYACLG